MNIKSNVITFIFHSIISMCTCQDMNGGSRSDVHIIEIYFTKINMQQNVLVHATRYFESQTFLANNFLSILQNSYNGHQLLQGFVSSHCYMYQKRKGFTPKIFSVQSLNFERAGLLILANIVGKAPMSPIKPAPGLKLQKFPETLDFETYFDAKGAFLRILQKFLRNWYDERRFEKLFVKI